MFYYFIIKFNIIQVLIGSDTIKKHAFFLDIGRGRVPGTGMAVYTQRLHHQFSQIQSDVKSIDIPVVDNTRIKDKFYAYAFEQLFLPIFMLSNKGVCHRTSNIGIPFLSLTPYIITIHDLIPVLMPEQYLKSASRRNWFKLRQWWAVKFSSHIITDSDCSKKDILQKYRISASKITVIPLGVDSCYSPQAASNIKAVCNKYKLPEKYILSIGGDEYRKNNKRLIEAFKKLKSQVEIPHKLVIIGKYKSSTEFALDCSDIILTGFVDEMELPALYAGADLFVFPSIYEGFGLPVLEAQACGTAVACSNTSSIPEVGNDSVEYFDPENVDSISNAIYRVISNPNLQNELVEKGLTNCKYFSWQDTAMKTLKVYQSLILE